MKNINISKRIDEDYRKEARRLLIEVVATKKAIYPEEDAESLLIKYLPSIKRKLYYYARKRRMVNISRIRPHNGSEVIFHKETRTPEYYDMPKEFLDVETLVSDFQISSILHHPYSGEYELSK